MDVFTIFLLMVAGFIIGKTFVEVCKLLILCHKDMKLLKLDKEIDWHYKLGLYETIQIKIGKGY